MDAHTTDVLAAQVPCPRHGWVPWWTVRRQRGPGGVLMDRCERCVQAQLGAALRRRWGRRPTLTVTQLDAIRTGYAQGVGYVRLGQALGLPPSAVKATARRFGWRRAVSPYLPSDAPPRPDTAVGR